MSPCLRPVTFCLFFCCLLAFVSCVCVLPAYATQICQADHLLSLLYTREPSSSPVLPHQVKRVHVQNKRGKKENSIKIAHIAHQHRPTIPSPAATP
jgi:hypothetical protein